MYQNMRFRAVALCASMALVSFICQAAIGAEAPNKSKPRIILPPLADLTEGMKTGTPEIKSAGPLAFGLDGILFWADPSSATIFAIATGDAGPRSGGTLNIEGINGKIAARLGTAADQIRIIDLAINPESGAAYLSVARGTGPDAVPVLVRAKADGSLEDVSLENAKFSSATLPNAPDAGSVDRRGGSRRAESITDLAFALPETDDPNSEGLPCRVLVAGLSNEEFSSRLRTIPFPFSKADAGASVEIYHGSHGKLETASPIRTFVLYAIQGDPHIVAAYTCTPLVKLREADLKPGKHVKGTTVAELGNRNRPLDMIVYTDEGKDVLLMANSSRGVMKIPTEGLDNANAIEEPIRDKAGLNYETIDELKGVEQLDRYDADHAAIITKNADTGVMDLKTIELP